MVAVGDDDEHHKRRVERPIARTTWRRPWRTRPAATISA
jgi:hypothetical protein